MIQSLSDRAGMLNLPDLILLLFLIWSVINGERRGFIMSVIGLVGRIAVVLGACWLAKTCAPTLASAVVTPFVGKAFADQAAQSPELSGILDGLQMTVTEGAQSVAEGIAFVILSAVFLVLLSLALSFILHSLSLLTRFPPLGWLNRLAGAAFGLVSGLAVALLLVWCAHLVRPDLFSALGWLSPERIQSTVLVRELLAYFPF